MARRSCRCIVSATYGKGSADWRSHANLLRMQPCICCNNSCPTPPCPQSGNGTDALLLSALASNQLICCVAAQVAAPATSRSAPSLVHSVTGWAWNCGVGQLLDKASSVHSCGLYTRRAA